MYIIQTTPETNLNELFLSDILVGIEVPCFLVFIVVALGLYKLGPCKLTSFDLVSARVIRGDCGNENLNVTAPQMYFQRNG